MSNSMFWRRYLFYLFAYLFSNYRAVTACIYSGSIRQSYKLVTHLYLEYLTSKWEHFPFVKYKNLKDVIETY